MTQRTAPNLFKRFWSTPFFFKIGSFIVLVMTICAIFAPLLAPHDPNLVDAHSLLLSPSSVHFMGTDEYGRDIFSRVLYGGRISLYVGFVSVSISICIGILLGLTAGYFGGITDSIIMRFVDTMLCFPSFFLILAVVAFLEPNLINIMIIIGLTSWMGITRLIRAETLSLKKREFIDAARLAGASTPRILFLHILPNTLAPVLVSATLGISGAILLESTLSFLGLGPQPPTPSWGNMLMEGKRVLVQAPWLSLFPGMIILVTVLGYNFLGESLRDIFDPRLRK